MNGKLYLVATPIGNLEDISYRAINILKDVDLIAAEDTRHTLGLLNYYNISKPLISYYKEVEQEKSETIINKLLSGENIALVSDAGTPGISDPGEVVVKKAIVRNIDIIPVPGACALINALICSGISTKEFCFIGFLPTQSKAKTEKLNDLKYYTQTLVFYEAPHKIKATLELMLEVLGNREICLTRELTKIHEEKRRGKISEILEHIDDIKGEMVIIIEGSHKSIQENFIDNLNLMSLEEQYEYYKNKGYNKKEIIKQIAKNKGTNKNEIYQYFLDY